MSGQPPPLCRGFTGRRIAAVAVFGALTTFAGVGVVSADTGSNATTVPIVSPSNALSSVVQNNEPVQLIVPSGDLARNSAVVIYACDDPTGNITSAYLSALSKYSCDGETAHRFVTNAAGGLTTPDPVTDQGQAYVVYSLPNRTDLGQSSSNAACDLTHECILYIGPTLDDPDDGSGVVYSRPFFVDQHYDYLSGDRAPAATSATSTTVATATSAVPAANSGSPTTTGPSTVSTRRGPDRAPTEASSAAVTLSPASVSPTTTPAAASSDSELAYTGFAPWPLVIIGAVLAISGELARRRRVGKVRR